MQPWMGFYATTAGAAAALLGLLFVAVSVDAAANFRERMDAYRALSEQALQNYSTTLFISLVALMPDLSLKSFGAVTLMLAGLSGLVTAARVAAILVRRTAMNRVSALRRHGVSLLGFVLLIDAAAQLWSGRIDHLGLAGAGVVVLLASATMSAWELLVFLKRDR